MDTFELEYIYSKYSRNYNRNYISIVHYYKLNKVNIVYICHLSDSIRQYICIFHKPNFNMAHIENFNKRRFH